VVVGEWGGRYGVGGVGQADLAWQNAFVDYLKSKGITSSFYWCYTPNSGDTGGILDDNLVVRQDKMQLLQRHWATVTPPPPPPPVAYPQQFIQSFKPMSGVAGTLVTITGSGFLGSTLASLGNAKNLPLTVLSDSKVQMTIPSGVSSAAIGIFNPAHAAFTARSFSLSTSPPPTKLVQQTISGFTPTGGKPGTVVTVSGSGFMGSTIAFLGTARDIVLTVISDREARFTVPANASNGAIGIYSPAFTAFSPTWFVLP
jgi:hypothetical protein